MVAETAVLGGQPLENPTVELIVGVRVVYVLRRVNEERVTADGPAVNEGVGDDAVVYRHVSLFAGEEPLHLEAARADGPQRPRHVQVAVGRVGGVDELVLAVAQVRAAQRVGRGRANSTATMATISPAMLSAKRSMPPYCTPPGGEVQPDAARRAERERALLTLEAISLTEL